MPASIIRNTTLQNMYKNNQTVRKNSSFLDSESESDESSIKYSIQPEIKSDRDIRGRKR